MIAQEVRQINRLCIYNRMTFYSLDKTFCYCHLLSFCFTLIQSFVLLYMYIEYYFSSKYCEPLHILNNYYSTFLAILHCTYFFKKSNSISKMFLFNLFLFYIYCLYANRPKKILCMWKPVSDPYLRSLYINNSNVQHLEVHD